MVVLKEALQLLEVLGFVGLDPHFFLFDEERIFKVQDGGLWMIRYSDCPNTKFRDAVLLCLVCVLVQPGEDCRGAD